MKLGKTSVARLLTVPVAKALHAGQPKPPHGTECSDSKPEQQGVIDAEGQRSALGGWHIFHLRHKVKSHVSVRHYGADSRPATDRLIDW